MQAKLKALRETADRRNPAGSNPKMWLWERGGEHAEEGWKAVADVKKRRGLWQS